MKIRPVLAAAAAVGMLTLIGGSSVPGERQTATTMVAADYATGATAGASITDADPTSEMDATPSVLPSDAETSNGAAADTDAVASNGASIAIADSASARSTPCSIPSDKIQDESDAARLDAGLEDAVGRELPEDDPLGAAVKDIRDLLHRFLSASDAPTAPTDTSAADAPSTTTDEPAESPTTSSAWTSRTRASSQAALPSDVLELGNWYLTLPTGKPGSPDTIENPSLLKFTNEFFKLTPGRNGVVFSANGDGVTTKNSHYPRSELREMNGSQKASWSNTTGTHTLDVCEAFTKLPQAKPEVVGVQIHDASDDVLQIRLEGQKLIVQYADGKSEALLDPAYKLGTPFNVKIVAAGGKVDISYNGQSKASLPLSGSGWYWKVGAYVQSNASKGDTGSSSTGEVVVYSIDMTDQAAAGSRTPAATTAAPTTTATASAPVPDDGAKR